MKTLYISDLDGTLLAGDATVSDFTADTLNRLIEQGVLFSYATARSYVTAGQITAGITARFPLILYNGVFVLDNVTKEPIITNFFENRQAWRFVDLLLANDVYPLVYHYGDKRENMAFWREKSSRGLMEFITEYEGTLHRTTVADRQDLYREDTFYIVCIDDARKLYPLYQQLKDNPACNVIYQTDVYTGRQWLEILPAAAGKDNAVMMLKEKLGCDRVVCFGDGKNDISMFMASDECYAVANAVDELKTIATGVIGSNNEDGVARWLAENAEY